MNIRKHSRLGAVTAGLTAAALLLAGCSGGGDSAAARDTAALYSGSNETTNEILVKAGAALDPSLKINIVTGSTGPLFERIKSEDPAIADVFWGGNGEQYVDAAEPYVTTEADAILEEARDHEGRWTPTNQHVVAFMANVDQIANGEAPTSWKDLTDTKWAGKIIVADPTQSTTALTALYGAYKVLGAEDFTKLAANLEITESSSNVYPAVAQGEYAVAIAYESNIYPYIAGGQAGIEMTYPDDGTFVEFDSIILVNGAPNPEAGKRVIDTLLSKEVQEQQLAESFRRPVRTDIDPSEFIDFKSLDDLNLVEVSGEADEQGQQDFLEFWGTL